MAQDAIEQAVDAFAEEIYDSQAPKSAPAFADADPIVRIAFRERALTLINIVTRYLKPVDAEAAILRLQINMLADEIGQQRNVQGPKVAEVLRALATEQVVEPTDKESD